MDRVEQDEHLSLLTSVEDAYAKSSAPPTLVDATITIGINGYEDDLTGAERSVHSIVGALGWRQGYDVLGVLGEVDDAALDAAYALGATITALLTD